ncbi:MAG: multiheme c-type cytochrome, partial [Candidatus Krumholzibacteriia bacterium]
VKETLNELVPKMRKKADLVVLFAHVGNRNAQKLLDEIKGIDIAITGGDAFVNAKPVEIGNEETGRSLVCSAGKQAKYLGALKVVLSEKGQLLRYTHELHSLDKSIKEDPEMRARVDEFKAQLREVRKREEVERVVGNQQTTVPTEKFLGSNTCSRCHEAEFQSWTKSAHAHSMASLEGKSMEGSAECLQCHVTGYKEANGYAMNRADLGKISCEQCHGHGTLHGHEDFVARPSAESCTVCHDKKNSPDFDYAAYWKAIAH